MTAPLETPEHVDVLIIGAGLSGIGAAWHVKTLCPGKSFAIWEGRDAIGGTWDLFRYPGVRSDSDMFTLGYRFRPWPNAKAIADGPAIKAYVEDAARDIGVDEKIRFNHWVTDISWSSRTARWTVTARTKAGSATATCDFLLMCAGYYKYAEGYAPAWPGMERFKGRIIHPQHWPEDLDYAGKRVVVIGSGATAVTLVPSMAEKAAQVTMLQRSPTYMFSMPGTSALALGLRRVLPLRVVYQIMRWQRIVFQQWVYKQARRKPKETRERLLRLTRERLPAGYDVDKHFSPAYAPWDQRICLVPDDDLFAAIRSGKAAVETDEIETFTEEGITLKSGKTLAADIVVTATGLVLEVLGGAKARVDGREINFGETVTYKGLMFSGAPNLASIFGYTNASWTLRADLVAEYVCRLINYMDENDFASATPTVTETMPLAPFLDFSSGYVRRAVAAWPKQGTGPWRHPQDYFADRKSLLRDPLDDGALVFTKKPSAAVQKAGADVSAA